MTHGNLKRFVCAVISALFLGTTIPNDVRARHGL